jgi:hypothetical protein
LLPKQVLYQAELHSELCRITRDEDAGGALIAPDAPSRKQPGEPAERHR